MFVFMRLIHNCTIHTKSSGSVAKLMKWLEVFMPTYYIKFYGKISPNETT